MIRALEGLRVVDFAEGIAGPFMGKLMAGLGAEVIKVELPDGDAARRVGPFPGDTPDPESSGLYLYLNTGKKGITVDPARGPDAALITDLISSADVIIECFSPGWLESQELGYPTLSAANSGLVMVSITPFGQTGPYSDFAATNMVVHALSGELHLAGSSDQPLKKGGNLADYHAGVHGYIAAMAALHCRQITGRGQHVDVSAVESVTAILGASVNSWLYDGEVSRRGDADPWSKGTAAQRGLDGRHWGPSGAWEASNGHVLAYGRRGADWAGMFRDMAEDEPEFADPAYASDEGRDEAVRELMPFFESWVSKNEKQEVYRLAQEHGHAYGFVATAPDLLASPQLANRRFFVSIDHPVAGELPFPGAPFVMSRTPFDFTRAPLLGEHNGEVRSEKRREREAEPSAGSVLGAMPLEGVRVLDFTHVWAGPYCTRLLGDMGAEVIKAERVSDADMGRGKSIGRFHAYSRNKLGITLDLRTDDGHELVQNLISVSDIVVENFSVGVTKRLGIDYEHCRELRPDIVYLAMPAFGRTGPESSNVGMGATQEAMSGLLSITGLPGAPPNPTGVKYGDPNGGVFGAAAAITALWHRRLTGEGQLVDLSQLEANIATLPEIVLGYAMNGRALTQIGNRHPTFAPRGVYRCRGDDRWVAIEVTSNAQFSALCDAMGKPELTADPRFRAMDHRKQHHDELDGIIGVWTEQRDPYEAMRLLQESGVPAGAVLNNKDLLEDPHFAARGLFETVGHGDAGTHTHIGLPWKLSDTPLSIRRFAPEVGQHSEQVLGELLGVPETELRRLADLKVTSGVPERVA